jgi:hypothetical protein
MMTLNKLRIALAEIMLALAAVSAVDSASAQIAITIEPGGGSDEPTSDPVLDGFGWP